MVTRFVLILALAMITGCHSSPDDIGPQQTEAAYIYDSSRYADGCEVYIGLDVGSSYVLGTQYKPLTATFAIVQKFLAGFPDSTRVPVTIRFVETKNRVKIQCGWYSPTVAEINVLFITKR